ncbi:MAG: cysteine desulfurase [Thermoplasmata archaeon]|nr:MAG: cysteine desulfurase [Thermoplasmata archaeon]
MIYLDNENVTKVDPAVLEAMKERYTKNFGVPGGEFGHAVEEEASNAIWEAREVVARKINAEPDEIIFTSGVTESNNLAIKGSVFYFSRRKGKAKIVTSEIERKCILNSFKYLSELGHEAVFVGVDGDGQINMEELEKAAKNSFLVSIHHANHEIGVLQDLKAIGEIANDAGSLFHVDATHSFLKEKIDVEKYGIDMMTMSGHVIHAPLGSGALFIRDGVKLEPLFHGDAREFGYRAGHPNMPAIAGFAKAVELMKEEHIQKMKRMQQYLIKNLLSIEDSRLNGSMKRVCNNVNVSFKGVEGEAILMMANQKGLIIRTGSACYSPELKPSYVILAIGGSMEDANSSTRITISRMNTMEEMEKAYEILKDVIERLREFSPLYRRKK